MKGRADGFSTTLFRAGMAAVSLGLLAGCGSFPTRRGWGEGATFRPGWSRVRNAAWSSLASPGTWAPAGAALLLQIDDADERVSDWAVENNPLFGSAGSAEKASDIFVYTSFALFGATALAAPGGDAPEHARLKGLGIQTSALLLAGGTVELLKAGTRHIRPNGEDQKSFPSGHAALSATSSVLAYRNVEYLPLPNWGKASLKTGLVVLPYATGWARVEAAKHYPSDVLAGAALGHFIGAFVNDAFMGVDSADDLQITFDYLPGETLVIGFSRRF